MMELQGVALLARERLCTGTPGGGAAGAELEEVRRGPAKVWRVCCTSDRRRGRKRLRRGGNGTPRLETRKKRHGEQEGSEVEPVEEFITCWSVRGGPASSWKFYGGCLRRRRFRRRWRHAGGVRARSWRRRGGLGGFGGPSPRLYTRVVGVGANAR